MNAQETLKIITKQWCNLSDLMKLLGCGRNKALDVKKQIKDKLISEGYFIPGNDLPMQAVVDVLKIDIDRLEKIIISASKQSIKPYIPVLNPMTSFADFLNNYKDVNTQKFIAHCYNDRERVDFFDR